MESDSYTALNKIDNPRPKTTKKTQSKMVAEEKMDESLLQTQVILCKTMQGF